MLYVINQIFQFTWKLFIHLQNFVNRKFFERGKNPFEIQTPNDFKFLV